MLSECAGRAALLALKRLDFNALTTIGAGVYAFAATVGRGSIATTASTTSSSGFGRFLVFGRRMPTRARAGAGIGHVGAGASDGVPDETDRRT